MHSKEKEESGDCCQTAEEQDNAEQATYEHSIKTKEPK